MRRKINTLLALCMAALLSSCEYNYAHYEEKESVSFESELAPIFTNKCSACHNSTGNLPNLSEGNAFSSLILNSYVNTNDAANSKLMLKINSGHPTAGTLTSTEKQTILQWIQEGAQNN